MNTWMSLVTSVDVLIAAKGPGFNARSVRSLSTRSAGGSFMPSKILLIEVYSIVMLIYAVKMDHIKEFTNFY